MRPVCSSNPMMSCFWQIQVGILTCRENILSDLGKPKAQVTSEVFALMAGHTLNF